MNICSTDGSTGLAGQASPRSCFDVQGEHGMCYEHCCTKLVQPTCRAYTIFNASLQARIENPVYTLSISLNYNNVGNQAIVLFAIRTQVHCFQCPQTPVATCVHACIW